MSTKHKLTALEQQRVRIAKLCLCALLVFFVVLALTRVLEKKADAFQLQEQLLSQATMPSAGSSVALGDCLGIASEELRFEQCSDDGAIIWYSTQGNEAYSACLVDRALTAQGWLRYQDDAQSMCSYVRDASATASQAYALVLCYEHSEGCTIIIEVL
jgi:hypothetical protein